MPIIIQTHSGKQIVVRGEHLGLGRRILLALRLPIRLKAMESDDIFILAPNSASYIQTFSDAEAERRKKDYEARKKFEEEERKKHNPNPGGQPRRIIPSSRG